MNEKKNVPLSRKLPLYFGLFGIIPVTVLFIIAFSNGDITEINLQLGYLYATSIFRSFIITATTSWAVILVLEKLDEKVPWNKGWLKRLILEFLLSNAATFFTVSIVAGILFILFSMEDVQGEILRTGVISIIMNLTLVSIYEGMSLFRKWKHSLVRAEQLEKENMISRFEALKNQVNPHFLFNSLNTLSSLIHIDTEKSEKFIEEFSNIYRYILEHTDEVVVKLEDEIEFAKSFLFLQKMRFGESLQYNIKMDSRYLDAAIPTMSMQTVIENAIKHNKVTKTNPLTIDIYTENNKVIVRNNFQSRKENVSSTKTGINNLNERYGFLSDRKPEFYIGNNHYFAELPIIEE